MILLLSLVMGFLESAVITIDRIAAARGYPLIAAVSGSFATLFWFGALYLAVEHTFWVAVTYAVAVGVGQYITVRCMSGWKVKV